MAVVFLDTSVFLDYFLNGPKFHKSSRWVERLEDNRLKAVTSSFGILELKYHLIKEKGHTYAEETVFLIKRNENLEIVPLTSEIAERAADIRFRYYNREKRPLSFADSVHIATAIEKSCSKIITTDSDFGGISEIRTELY